MGLQEEIEKERSEIRTESYSMSVGELQSLYDKKEIILRPDFQRLFRWSITQKTRFIESVLLGIPLPAIFVFQRKDGIWEVIDGLQRISTLLELMGELRKDDSDEKLPQLQLGDADYLKSLKGRYWQGLSDEDPNALTAIQKLYIRRAKIHVNILLRESDERSKFELFRRLNTGGSTLVEQEIRNCLLLMENKSRFKWLLQLTQNAKFQHCIELNDRLLEEQFDGELASRFIVLRKKDPLTGIGNDLGEYLTDEIIKIARDPNFDEKEEGDAFIRTFEALDAALGSDAFHRYDAKKNRFLGPFSQSAFEVIALGIGYHASGGTPNNIVEIVKSLWNNAEFKAHTGGGISAASRIPRTVQLGRSLFKP